MTNDDLEKQFSQEFSELLDKDEADTYLIVFIFRPPRTAFFF
jgi:hypothetical protein